MFDARVSWSAVGRRSLCEVTAQSRFVDGSLNFALAMFPFELRRTRRTFYTSRRKERRKDKESTDGGGRGGDKTG